MDYETAKRLKDAGFKCSEWVVPMYFDSSLPIAQKGDELPNPTLEELIEACGEDFHSLEQDHKKSSTWRVVPTHYKANNPNNFFIGPTPTIAVARLWLALNANNTTDGII